MSKYTVALSLVIVAALGFYATPALASVGGFAEEFNYANGELTINDGTGDDVSGGLWAPHSGSTFGDNIMVSNGGILLNFPGSEDANRLTGGVLAAGEKIYAAFDFSVDRPLGGTGTLGPSPQYFAHFKDATFGFRARVFITDPSVGGDYSVALAASGGTANSFWAADFAFGQTVQAILSYDYDSGDVELWLDPVNQSSTSIVDTGVNEPSSPMTAINSFAFRQAFYTTTNQDYQVRVENNYVSDNFTDVFNGVPEPSTLGMLAVGGLLLIRRRRR